MTAHRIIPGKFYRHVPDGDGPVEGWTIPPDQSDPVIVWVIRNDLRTSPPVRMKVLDIEELLAAGEWVETSGPIKPKVEIEDLSEERQKEIKGVEEHRYQVIKPLIDLGAEAFWPHVRRKAMDDIAAKNNITVDNVWQWLCAYWQFAGKIGLRPRAVLAGQKRLQERIDSAEKAAKRAEEECQKTGNGAAKHASEFFVAYKTGRPKHADTDLGKPMGFSDVMTCRRAAKKHLFVKSPDHQLRYNYDAAYDALLADYYGYARGSQDNPPVPSKDQFIKAVVSDPEFARLSVRIVGKASATRDHRRKTGTTQFEVLGPGHVLQIDDVVPKVLFIHPNTRMPFSAGNLFVGSDQWSKAIAGGHLTLEGSSFEGVKELCVVVSLLKDKQFFEQRGLNIDPIHFPASGVFRYITADKGPLGGSLGNILPEGFADLNNPASYRPDMKPDIESSFHAYLLQNAEKLPGYNRVERGGENLAPEIIACLTPGEFMMLWWGWAEQYNQRLLDGYLPEEALKLEPDLRPGNTPFELWSWGLDNVSGYILHKPEDEIRRNLLRKHKGTLTKRDGIKFLKLHYLIDGDTSIRFRSTPVTIYYSESYLRQIYVWLDGRLVTASMRQDDAQKFGHLTYHEILAEKILNEKQAVRVLTNHRKAKVKAYRTRQEVCAESHARRAAVHPNEKLRRMVVKGVPKSIARAGALAIERQTAHDAEARAFPPNIETPTPPPAQGAIPKKKSVRELRGQTQSNLPV